MLNLDVYRRSKYLMLMKLVSIGEVAATSYMSTVKNVSMIDLVCNFRSLLNQALRDCNSLAWLCQGPSYPPANPDTLCNMLPLLFVGMVSNWFIFRGKWNLGNWSWVRFRSKSRPNLANGCLIVWGKRWPRRMILMKCKQVLITVNLTFPKVRRYS